MENQNQNPGRRGGACSDGSSIQVSGHYVMMSLEGSVYHRVTELFLSRVRFLNVSVGSGSIWKRLKK